MGIYILYTQYAYYEANDDTKRQRQSKPSLGKWTIWFQKEND